MGPGLSASCNEVHLVGEKKNRFGNFREKILCRFRWIRGFHKNLETVRFNSEPKRYKSVCCNLRENFETSENRTKPNKEVQLRCLIHQCWDITPAPDSSVEHPAGVPLGPSGRSRTRKHFRPKSKVIALCRPEPSGAASIFPRHAHTRAWSSSAPVSLLSYAANCARRGASPLAARSRGPARPARFMRCPALP